MTTIKDISRLAGVSKSTISRYLNNGSVSKDTADKIKKIIDDLGYVPNSFAQSLKASTTNKIGIIIPNFIGVTKNLSLTAIDDYLKKNSYKMFISNSNDSMEDEIKIIQSMVSQKMDGIILFASDITEKHIEIINNIDIPVVIIGQKADGIHHVVHDDFKAGQLIGKHILDTCHKEISYFGVGDYDKSIYDRYLGMMDMVGKYNDIRVNYHTVGFKSSSGYDKVLETYSIDKSTYYVAATDSIAYGMMKAFNKLNLNIPDDICISGFGNYDMDVLVNPTLTSIYFSYYDIGKYAASILLDIISGKDVDYCNVLDCDIVIRNSTKSINK